MLSLPVMVPLPKGDRFAEARPIWELTLKMHLPLPRLKYFPFLFLRHQLMDGEPVHPQSALPLYPLYRLNFLRPSLHLCISSINLCALIGKKKETWSLSLSL